MNGPFIATAQIEGPFKVRSEPYMIWPATVGSQSRLRGLVGLAVVILAVVIAYVVVRLVRTKQTK